jgi:choline-sulfatase
VAAFEAELRANWDSAAIAADVIASQDRRRVVHAAMEHGAWTSWDYQPKRDAAQEFVRNTVSWDDVLHRMQYPRPNSE